MYNNKKDMNEESESVPDDGYRIKWLPNPSRRNLKDFWDIGWRIALQPYATYESTELHHPKEFPGCIPYPKDKFADLLGQYLKNILPIGFKPVNLTICDFVDRFAKYKRVWIADLQPYDTNLDDEIRKSIPKRKRKTSSFGGARSRGTIKRKRTTKSEEIECTGTAKRGKQAKKTKRSVWIADLQPYDTNLDDEIRKSIPKRKRKTSNFGVAISRGTIKRKRTTKSEEIECTGTAKRGKQAKKTKRNT